jgi:hypothetical protein
VKGDLPPRERTGEPIDEREPLAALGLVVGEAPRAVEVTLAVLASEIVGHETSPRAYR